MGVLGQYWRDPAAHRYENGDGRVPGVLSKVSESHDDDLPRKTREQLMPALFAPLFEKSEMVVERRHLLVVPSGRARARVAIVNPTLSTLVASAEQGDRAAANTLFATLYDELRRMAGRELARRGAGVTLGATTLLHEAYLDISDRERAAFPDRNRFM